MARKWFPGFGGTQEMADSSPTNRSNGAAAEHEGPSHAQAEDDVFLETPTNKAVKALLPERLLSPSCVDADRATVLSELCAKQFARLAELEIELLKAQEADLHLQQDLREARKALERDRADFDAKLENVMKLQERLQVENQQLLLSLQIANERLQVLEQMPTATVGAAPGTRSVLPPQLLTPAVPVTPSSVRMPAVPAVPLSPNASAARSHAWAPAPTPSGARSVAMPGTSARRSLSDAGNVLREQTSPATFMCAPAPNAFAAARASPSVFQATPPPRASFPFHIAEPGSARMSLPGTPTSFAGANMQLVQNWTRAASPMPVASGRAGTPVGLRMPQSFTPFAQAPAMGFGSRQ